MSGAVCNRSFGRGRTCKCLSRVKCQVHYCGLIARSVHGEDIATTPQLGRELASSIPGAQFCPVENAAHLACVEQPEIMAERMMDFFREVKIV